LRPVDLGTAGAIWFATLKDHKTAHHDQARVLHFGPQAQVVFKPFLAYRPVHGYLFDPREGVRERAQKTATHRRPDQKPNSRKTSRMIRDHYTVGSYRRAIHRACDVAGVPPWSPNRLRHKAATAIRREFGIEAAQVVLGHTTPDTTVIYAERNLSKAAEVAAQIG
jgi:integrase